MLSKFVRKVVFGLVYRAYGNWANSITVRAFFENFDRKRELVTFETLSIAIEIWIENYAYVKF